MSKEYSVEEMYKANENQTPQPPKKDNRVVILLSVILVLLLAIITVFVVIFMKDKDNNENPNETQSQSVEETASNQANGNFTFPSAGVGFPETSNSQMSGSSTQENPHGIVQPSIDNGTAVIEYPSNKDDSEITVTKVTEVNNPNGTLLLGKSLDDLDKTKKDRLIARSSDFGIDEAKMKDITKDGTSWTMFSAYIYVANTDKKNVAIGSVKATNNEKILIDKSLGCEYGLSPGKGTYITIEGIVDSSKLNVEEAILAELKGMDIKLVYTRMDNSTDSVDDWSKVDLMYMPVKF